MGVVYAVWSWRYLGTETYSTKKPNIIVLQWSIKMPARMFCSRRPMAKAMAIAIIEAESEYSNQRQ